MSDYRQVTRSKALRPFYRNLVLGLMLVGNVVGLAWFFLARMFIDHDFAVYEIAAPVRPWIERNSPGAAVVIAVWVGFNVAVLGLAMALPGEITVTAKPSQRH